MQRDDPMHTLIPRLDDYEDVEIMVVARPLRGAEGMGAATVGPGCRNTTYTGVRGPEAPKGIKGQRSTPRARPTPRTRVCATWSIRSVRCTRCWP